MRTLTFTLIAISIALDSCAPKQEQQQDATAVTDAAPVESGTASDDLQPITLTPELTETFNRQLYLWLHANLIEDGENLSVVEEFKTDGTNFEYKLVRDNLRNAGWHEPDEDEETDKSSYEENSQYAQGSGYDEVTSVYMNQVDTFKVGGSYEAYSKERYIVLKTKGAWVFVNSPRTSGDVVESIGPESEDIGQITLPAGDAIFTPDMLYLKARIVQLTDADLAGMSKDQLGYLRNEIFARHGHTFKTPKMVKYFNDQEWYHSNIDDATSLLNKFEKLNTDFIKSKEGK